VSRRKKRLAMPEKTALMIDGGFLKKKLFQTLHREATVQDITTFCTNLLAKPVLSDHQLLRIYFYDGAPFQGSVTNPLDGVVTNYSGSVRSLRNEKLLRDLELQPNFAVRRGVVSFQGWKLGGAALRSLSRNRRAIVAHDLIPDLKQKGVDMRIGLDISWVATKRIIDAIILVTGDSDFIPAMKLARKEGIRIYLETMGHPVYVQLKAHADIVL
jgi:uncharacterized LabA/DUF88 family protein